MRRGGSRAALTAALVLVVAAGCGGPRPPRWQQVDGRSFTAPGGSVTVSALLGGAGPQPWLAVGWQIDGRGAQSPAGWHSADGQRWDRDPIRAASFDGPLERLLAVARRGVVAVSPGQVQSATEGNLRPSMWSRGPDGAWHESPAPRELFGGERTGGLVTVAAAPSQFLATGGWTGPDGQFDIGVWTSPDGGSWTRLDGDPALSPRRGESIRAIAATAASPGIVLAGEADLGPARQGVAWWSADGHAWVRADVAGSASLQQIVAVPAGFVAVGLRSNGAPSAWRSADGRHWQPAGGLAAPAGASVEFTGAAADGATVVVGGLVAGRPALWRMDDNGHWHTLALPHGMVGAPASPVAVAARSGSVVVAVNGAGGPQLWRAP